MRATAVLVRRPHMRRAAPGDREQGHASSLHPEGQCSADQTCTERQLLHLILAAEHTIDLRTPHP